MEFQNVEFLFGRIYLNKNTSKIQYLSVANTKTYKVTDIDFHNLTIKASKTDLSIADIPESELFPVEELLGEYRIKLHNGDGSGMGNVIDFTEYAKVRKHYLWV